MRGKIFRLFENKRKKAEILKEIEKMERSHYTPDGRDKVAIQYLYGLGEKKSEKFNSDEKENRLAHDNNSKPTF